MTIDSDEDTKEDSHKNKNSKKNKKQKQVIPKADEDDDILINKEFILEDFAL